MHKIFKYPLRIADENTMSNRNFLDHEGCLNIVMPSGSVILDIQHQRGNLMLWASVPADNPDPLMCTRKLRVVGTGHPVDMEHSVFIKTIQEADGCLVWHLFDLGEYHARS